jgi:RNA polymerase sigma factor (TIGR02999 family)
MAQGQVTVWLDRWRAGDHAALDNIVPLVYRELCRVAERQLRHQSPAITLSATALVHETYLRLVRQRQIQAVDRDTFLATAGHTMRRILVDHARARRRLKRGRGYTMVDASDAGAALLTEAEVDEVLAIEDVLERLAAADPRAARIVEYRVFAGFTLEETAQALAISTKTVQRTWLAARAFLRKEVGHGVGSRPLGVD